MKNEAIVDIDDFRQIWVSRHIEYLCCGHKVIATFAEGTPQLECSRCHKMTAYRETDMTGDCEWDTFLPERPDWYKAAILPQNTFQLPRYRMGKDGFPIELFEGKPFKSFVRLVVQNIRKVIG